jgi:peptide/nickel transport system ATP-binding protein
VEEGDTEELFARPRHPYTQLLLQTIPNIDAPRRDRELVAGEVPSPLKPPSGCTFHPRCPLATARCSAEVPKVRTLAGGTRVACHLVADEEELVVKERELV